MNRVFSERDGNNNSQNKKIFIVQCIATKFNTSVVLVLAGMIFRRGLVSVFLSCDDSVQVLWTRGRALVQLILFCFVCFNSEMTAVT